MRNKLTRTTLALIGGMVIAGHTRAQPFDDPFYLENIPEVITPTRLKQSLHDVPASVTIITRDTIRALGIRTVPEALRLVPGFVVGQAAGNDYRLEYQATNGQLPRRMQVMVDGMSIYGTESARVYWNRMPVSIEDIDRIEITRGPNSATYGSNALLAIVNIITRHPEDSIGMTVSTLYGSLSTLDVMARYAKKIGNTAFRVTVERQADDGFDFNETRVEDRRDSIEVNRINVRSVSEFDTSTLDIHLGALDTYWQDEYEEDNQTSFPDSDWKDQFAILTWDRQLSAQHALKIKTYGIAWEREQWWDTCYPTLLLTPELRALGQANADYAFTILDGDAPSGGSAQDDALATAVFDRIAALGGPADALSPTCARVNQNFDRAQYDLEFQDTYVFSNELRTVAGIGLRRESADSETYFANKKQTRDSARVFGNIEYKPTARWTFNLGGTIEREDDVLDDIEFSPKIGINYHFNPSNTLKLIYSEALRTPDFIGAARDWNYLFRDLDPPLDGQNQTFFFLRRDAVSAGDDQLKPERIISREVVYQTTLDHIGLSAELKLFKNNIRDAICEDFGFFVIDYSNNAYLELTGFETQLTYQPAHNFVTTLTYAQLENSSGLFTERSLYADKSGSFSAHYKMKNHWRLGLAHYAHNTGSDAFFDFRRTDLIVGYDASFEEYEFHAAFIARSQPKDQGAFARQEASIIRQYYEDSTHYYLKAEIGF